MHIKSSADLIQWLTLEIADDTDLLSCLSFKTDFEKIYNLVLNTGLLPRYLVYARVIIKLHFANLIKSDQACKLLRSSDTDVWVKMEQRFYPYFVANSKGLLEVV